MLYLLTTMVDAHLSKQVRNIATARLSVAMYTKLKCLESLYVLYFIAFNLCYISTHADLNDFDDTVLTVTFLADEDNPTSDIRLSIPITDDAINEATEQDFVVILNLTDSVNPRLTTLPRISSLCRIIDNDRKSYYAFTS